MGNTHFNSLIEAIDQLLSPDEFDITIQLAGGSYLPMNHKYFRLTDNISAFFAEADVIIAHAGAGTVFQLLEEHRKVVVVPNHERLDDHQLDLAQYVDDNQYACVCYEFNELKERVIEAKDKVYETYITRPFSGYEFIEKMFAGNSLPKREPNHVGKLPLNIYHSMEDAVDHIITPQGKVIAGSAIAINPEKVIKAIDEPSIREAIMSATIRYADGIGVVKTLRRKTKKKISRIPGCELWEAVMQRSAQFNLPVFLIGAKPEIIEETSALLWKQYSVKVCGKHDGYFDQAGEKALIDIISKEQPSIVTVALGSPRQELFIQKCRKVCPNAFFMGVGGTYDVYTNKVKRAPLVYRRLNLEWFYRLLSQPQRLFRQTSLARYLYLDLTRQL